MAHTNCSGVVDKISDVIDGQASLMSRILFYGHLMMCANCRRYFEQFKIVKEVAGKVGPKDLPGDFDRVMDFVMDEIEKQEPKMNDESR